MNIYRLNFDLHHGPYSVYLFEFPSGKKYVGSSKNPERRWKQGYAYNEDMTAEIEGAGGIDAISKSIVRTGLNPKEKAFSSITTPVITTPTQRDTISVPLAPAPLCCSWT